ncbi:hypothetical protein PTSG_12548 [Salpingoeca rosetta]|uniref:FAD-binding domain-containing protein n=1 Tax=Salpingoeca rosetta (strain ATCC 50818 / BSB-021) TaxID=946362 RepID=F2UEC1_SALR5|nr:uncharacterized protein PTSG_12548 [Salpingoeca rosetta]EGD74971.1 hypothetical protein PTSG_12548 [Salpingoeca rosetta]|eukprot:XP_004992616.1 hypothetical protein PTSG_12548 [Salpingoeca rosetta]
MRVGIVGGGIAGVTALRSLQRRGVQATLFEARSSVMEGVDRGLGIWPTAWKQLIADNGSGLQEQVSQWPSVPPASYRTRDGAWLSAPSKDTARDYEVKVTTRHTLLHALLQDTDQSAIHCNVQVARISNTDGPTKVLDAATGAELGCFDAVLMSGMAPDTAPVPVHSLSFIVPMQLRASAPFETLSGGRRFAGVPLNSSRCFIFATCSTSDTLHTIDDVARLYSTWHDPIPELIACARDAHVQPLYERARVSKLKRSADGVVAYIGDAAHCMQHNLAQGASLAIEDALYVAHVLSNVPSSPTAVARALEDYSTHRQARFHACRRVTAFTHLLAAMGGRWEERRNKLFLALPHALNSRCFDAFLKASFGHMFA